MVDTVDPVSSSAVVATSKILTDTSLHSPINDDFLL